MEGIKEREGRERGGKVDGGETGERDSEEERMEGSS